MGYGNQQQVAPQQHAVQGVPMMGVPLQQSQPHFVPVAPPVPGKYDPHGGEVVTGSPVYGDVPAQPDGRQRFISQGYKDVWAAGLFVLAVIATLGAVGYAFTKDDPMDLDLSGITLGTKAYRHHKYGTNTSGQTELAPVSTDDGDEDITDVTNLGVWIPTSIVMGAGVGTCLLLLLRAHPVACIWASNLLLCAYFIGFGIYLASIGSVSPLVFVLAVLLPLWLFLVRHRIPFAGVMLKTAIDITCRWKALLIVAFSCLALLAVFTVALLIAAKPHLPTHQYIKSYSFGQVITVRQQTKDGNVPILLLLCFSMFWTFQVVAGVVHVTACGVGATWFFFSSTQLPRNPTAKSFVRATTTSFGSICFGSLLVAILKMIKLLARIAMDNRNACLRCMVMFVLNCIDRLMQYFNKWAFAQIAIYGKSYIEAAKATWRMVKDGSAWEGVINDCLVDHALAMCVIFSGLLTGTVCGVVTSSVVMGLIGGLTALLVTQVMMGIVDSLVITVFICFAEAGDLLSVINRPLYNSIVEKLR